MSRMNATQSPDFRRDPDSRDVMSGAPSQEPPQPQTIGQELMKEAVPAAPQGRSVMESADIDLDGQVSPEERYWAVKHMNQEAARAQMEMQELASNQNAIRLAQMAIGGGVDPETGQDFGQGVEGRALARAVSDVQGLISSQTQQQISSMRDGFDAAILHGNRTVSELLESSGSESAGDVTPSRVRGTDGQDGQAGIFPIPAQAMRESVGGEVDAVKGSDIELDSLSDIMERSARGKLIGGLETAIETHFAGKEELQGKAKALVDAAVQRITMTGGTPGAEEQQKALEKDITRLVGEMGPAASIEVGSIVNGYISGLEELVRGSAGLGASTTLGSVRQTEEGEQEAVGPETGMTKEVKDATINAIQGLSGVKNFLASKGLRTDSIYIRQTEGGGFEEDEEAMANFASKIADIGTDFEIRSEEQIADFIESMASEGAVFQNENVKSAVERNLTRMLEQRTNLLDDLREREVLQGEEDLLTASDRLQEESLEEVLGLTNLQTDLQALESGVRDQELRAAIEEIQRRRQGQAAERVRLLDELLQDLEEGNI